MTFDRKQVPKTRPMPQNRTALVASLDIGTSKIACMIARLKPCPPNEALRGRSHAVELIGYSQIQSRGVKAGAVLDLAECEQAVRQAVALAEEMARVRVESVLLSVSAGRLQGQLIHNDDHRIQPQHKCQALQVPTRNQNAENRPDQRNHAAKIRDESHQAAQERPHRKKRHMKEPQSDQPHHRDTQGLNRNSAPPVHQRRSRRASRCLDVKAAHECP